ncbi:hypothetical protein GCM10022630_10340 [Thermobifida alba]
MRRDDAIPPAPFPHENPVRRGRPRPPSTRIRRLPRPDPHFTGRAGRSPPPPRQAPCARWKEKAAHSPENTPTSGPLSARTGAQEEEKEDRTRAPERSEAASGKPGTASGGGGRRGKRPLPEPAPDHRHPGPVVAPRNGKSVPRCVSRVYAGYRVGTYGDSGMNGRGRGGDLRP